MTTLPRTRRILKDVCEEMELDLSGLTIYTESATGNYSITAPLAAKAGAKTVVAYAEDSSYGTRQNAISETRDVAKIVKVEDRIQYPSEISKEDVKSADIVTNSGFVRPIDGEMIEWMKPTAAVPLMYEPWEFRPTDVDLEACWDAGIPVMGTNEADERVRTFEYIGELIIKLAHRAVVPVTGSKIIVVGGTKMTIRAINILERVGSEVHLVAPKAHCDEAQRHRESNILSTSESSVDIEEADLLVALEHAENYEIIGSEGLIGPSDLASRNPGLPIIHICGAVDSDAVDHPQLNFVPDTPSPFGHMSLTVGELGPEPIIRLHAGGLKVGASLTRARREGSTLEEAMEKVRKMNVASDFDESVKQQFR